MPLSNIGERNSLSTDKLLTYSPKQKKKILRKIMSECNEKIKNHKSKYKKLKKIDELIDGTTALLTGCSITCTITGMTIPPLLIASAALSSTSFIISRVQDKYNLKRRYEQHHISINQYSNISREIITVITKNNLSSDEYQNYIVEIYDKISLIEDTSIII